MEDDEDLLPEPDEKGQLVLSNRAWVNIDPQIWNVALRIVRLDISYNHVREIPKEIGELVVLRELIASFNKITYVPNEIGRLKRLRKLHLNNNRIKTIPAEVGNLELLEELILGENLLEELPSTVCKIANLRILRLTTNRLRTLPFELADIITLEEVDCGNNPEMDTVPAKWRNDTESLLFTCRVHRDYNVRMMEINEANADLTKHAQMLEQDNLMLKEKGLELQARIDDLYKNLPKNIAKKLEEAEKRAKEQELQIPEDDKKTNCIIS